MICLRVRFDIPQEFIRGCLKAAGQLEQGDDRRVAVSFFQTAEILLTEARPVCNLFLRQPTLFAQTCKILSYKTAHIHASAMADYIL